MKKKRQEALSKFILTIAQIAFAGIVVTSFSKEEIPVLKLIIGISATIITAVVGVLLTPKD